MACVDTLNRAWKDDKSAFGFKMLEAMGWSEGKGLGKNKDGITSYVKAEKRAQSLGLGAKADLAGNESWSTAAVSFSSVLANLNEKYSSSSSSSSSSSKGKSKKGRKRRRAEGIVPGEGMTHSSCPSKAKRIKSKTVKGYSSADLKAILGHRASAEKETAGGEKVAMEAEASDSEDAKARRKAEKEERKRRRRERRERRKEQEESAASASSS